ncbi:MAG: GH92 family glycosyl hydrolase, partial [bacterium]
MNRTAMILLAAGALLLSAAGCGRTPGRPSRHVDPFIGTGGHGHTHPAAMMPFGMVQAGPDNGRGGWDWTSGYHWSDEVILGFTHTHLSGTGIGDLRDILVMPVRGEAALAGPIEVREDADWLSTFDHGDEDAEPGWYRVWLEGPGVEAEMTATERVAIHRYRWPDTGRGEQPGVVLDLGFAANWDSPTDTHIQVEDDRTVSGWRFSTGWAAGQRTFFAIRFQHPFTSYAVAVDSSAADEVPEVHGRRTRALFRFADQEDRPLMMKVALSFVDTEGARSNLDAEAPGWDFTAYREDARRRWDEALEGVVVRGGGPERLKTFYTALYRTKQAPILFQDVDGRYRGGDGEIHRGEEGARRYAVFSLWDTFRAAHPLFTLTEPGRVPHMVRSMLDFQEETGRLPVWELVGSETNTMTGYHAVPVIADAWLKGFRGFDGRRALDAMMASAFQDIRDTDDYRRYGYIPSELGEESVTKTLEYAFDDWAIAAMAEAVGDAETARRFRGRAAWYRNLFDPGTGFMRGRHADGSWVEPFDPRRSSHRRNTDYTEGNAWQHSWFVPHDVQGLIDLHGGRRPFVVKLDSLFEIDSGITGEDVSPDISGLIGQYAHGNEPSHHIAYLYSWAGAPWKTAERVREILDTQYAAVPDGLAGNEDCGQMSAWYVFSALGFYPVNPTGGVYVLGSPLFEETTLEAGEGRTFTLQAEGLSDEAIYIQSASLNGEPLERTWVHHEEIVSGGRLTLEMGPQPHPRWGIYPEEAPPSMTLPGPDRELLAREVRDAFLHAWEGYRRYAWGHDDLRPLSRTAADWHSESLFMTPVDAFDTMVLMGLEEEAERAKSLILGGLDFDHDLDVQVFEITIRLLGGLISAYQLDGEEGFLELAVDLADRLLPAFDSPTGMPYTRVNLRTGEVRWPVNNPAEIGTLMLEFGTLSKLTGDPVYYRKAKGAVTGLFERRSDIGLVGTTIDVESGQWQDTASHISGRIDSYYEYLLKAWKLFDDEDFRIMWEESIEAVNTHLAETRPTGFWYGQADMHSGDRIGTRFGALDAFMPAVLALGGDVERARRLQESCYLMWTAHGIEPESMDYTTLEIRSPVYLLRPENIESAYYLFRLTGDPRYLEMGETMFRSIQEVCRVEAGYAEVADVRTGELRDY